MRITRVLSLCAVLGLAGCGSSGMVLAPDSGSPGPSGATITILLGGTINPKQVTIAIGQSVTFINNDNRTHEMDSDPHPQHTDCPSINAVGLLQPGQTRLTNAIPNATTCGFHDHGDSTNANLQGNIVIQ